MNRSCFILGIAGGSGSGKTFFAQALAKKLGNKAFVLYQDNYYIDQSDKFDYDGGSVNFDHPDSLDFDLMAAHLTQLKAGLDIKIPQYDFASHKRLKTTIGQAWKQVVIVDGILILTQPKLIKIFDETIYVETPENIRFERRLNRDVIERGRTPEGVKTQFEKQVKPMHDLFVEPSKHNAGMISSGVDMQAFYQLLAKIEGRIQTTTGADQLTKNEMTHNSI